MSEEENHKIVLEVKKSDLKKMAVYELYLSDWMENYERILVFVNKILSGIK